MSQVFLIIGAIVLNVCGHAFLKAGMNQVGVFSGELIKYAIRAVTTPFVLLGLLSYVSSVSLYMLVLAKTDLSYAYPLLMSVGYVLIVLVSFLIFKEPFSVYKWIGIGLILVGVILVGK
ncbi:MAG: EamA family transporter [candidate division Zixibacteria bacterium]|nr:EamA family transporter [candidate division Zixibacteria bacterium]